MLNIHDLKKVFPALGNTPGGLFQHQGTGDFYYVKAPEDLNRVHNEILASRLYELAGIGVFRMELMQMEDGRFACVSEYSLGIGSLLAIIGFTATKPNPLETGLCGFEPDFKQKLREHVVDKLEKLMKLIWHGFAVDCWLSNWDVCNDRWDNIGFTEEDEPIRLDVGGSLLYRARGEQRELSGVVEEIDTLRNINISPGAAQLFCGMRNQDIAASMQKVASIPDARIAETVGASGFDCDLKEFLSRKLVERKRDIERQMEYYI